MGDRCGQQLGNYHLSRLLGTGGFAEVYLAEHIYLKTQVAVKVLHAHLAQAELAGFLQEAQTIARLKHPHIISILDFGIDGTPFLVMDYLPLGSLRQRHPRGTIVPLETVISYVNQIASPLQYAHDAKVIHRDVKPDNMLINANNQIVLSDFGIAAQAHSTASLKTVDGSGTPYYMAPEHIQGKPRPASDQYALGIVVYEWLCGNPPFSGDPLQLMYQHSYAPIPPLQVEGKINHYHGQVEQIVMRAISKDPQDRFPDIRAFAQALNEAPKALNNVPKVDEANLADFFEVLFGKPAPNRRGDNIEQPVEVTLHEAYVGGTRTFNLQSTELCPNCHGTGELGEKACADCSGRGSLPHNKRIRVKIPAGVDNSSKIRVAGEGQPGAGGSPRGDLFLVISVKPDPLFERKGDDLYTDVEVEATTAKLGGEVPVPIPDGRKLILKIPAETPNGRLFRWVGAGIPRLREEGSGDLFARIKVIPSST